MDPLLEAALRAGLPIIHLVTVSLPDDVTIRWADRGFCVWDGETYQAEDATYGALKSIGKIVDGIDDDASPVPLEIVIPTLEGIEALAALDAQGGRTTIHMGALDRDTGLLIGEPYQLYLGELDQPVLEIGEEWVLTYDVIAADALALEMNEDQRMTDAFHQSVYPGELGFQYQTDGAKQYFWREDDPKLAIDFLHPRGRTGGHPTEFNYDPDAGWPLPGGRCGVGGTINRRVSYGPTNRYHSIIATVAYTGPIMEWVESRFDDEVVTFDPTLHKAENGQHEGFMWFLAFNGTQPQDAITSPSGVGAGDPMPGWDEDYRQSSAAIFCWTGFENSKKDEFGGGVPTMVHTIKGLFGHDPRDPDSDITDPSTWPWMADAGTYALNWCIGRWAGDSGSGTFGAPYRCSLAGGIGAPLDAIDVEAFSAAADISDDNGWSFAGVPTSRDDKSDVLKDMLRVVAARPSRKGGRISCICHGVVAGSVRTITRDDTAAKTMRRVLAPSRLDRRNTSTGTYWSEDHRWEMTTIAPVVNAVGLTEDGGRKRSTSFDYKYCDNADQCAALTYLELAMGREAISEPMAFMPWLMAVEAGQCVTWAEPGWLLDDVKVRIEKRAYDPMTTMVELTLRTEDDAKVAAALGETGVVPPPTEPVTPPAPYVEPPTELLVLEAGGTVSINYRNPNNDTYDFTNLLRATDSTTFGSATVIDFYGGGAGEYVPALTDTPTPGHSYSYWVQSVDIYGNLSDPVGPQTITL